MHQYPPASRSAEVTFISGELDGIVDGISSQRGVFCLFAFPLNTPDTYIYTHTHTHTHTHTFGDSLTPYAAVRVDRCVDLNGCYSRFSVFFLSS